MTDEIPRLSQEHPLDWKRNRSWYLHPHNGYICMDGKPHHILKICDKLQERLDAATDVLEMLSKAEIARWYKGDGVGEGYYASWDDAEYAVKIALVKIMEGSSTSNDEALPLGSDA